MTLAEAKVFYSWQSDLPNKTNRGLIEDALQAAVKAIRNDGSVEVEPVVDRDTAGVPGAPEIASTILKKIDSAEAFVCDVSRINAEFKTRPTPNPNVLIELGYAMKALGPERVVQVLNLAYGPVEELPFDLRQRRTLTYESRDDDKTRADQRKQLAQQLVRALEAILVEPVAAQDPSADAEGAIRNQTRDRALVVADGVKRLVADLEGTAPEETTEGERDDVLLSALEDTVEPTRRYAHLCRLAAVQGDIVSLGALHHGLEGIAKHYDPPTGFSGTWSYLPENYFAFLGREWMLLLVGALLGNGRLDMVGPILSEEIYVDNSRGGSVAYTHHCRNMQLFRARAQRLNPGKLSLVAELLRDRHIAEPLSGEVGVQSLAAADYLMSLRAAQESWPRVPWCPTVALFGNRPPRFVEEARRAQRAEDLVTALGEASVETLRARLDSCRGLLSVAYDDASPDDPLKDVDIAAIGTLP